MARRKNTDSASKNTDSTFVVEASRRQLIPVRLIPYITGWDFSPDVVVMMLAHTEKWHHIALTAMHWTPDGILHPMLPKEWDLINADIKTLDMKLKTSENFDQENYSLWRRESIKLIPATTFVFFDDLEAAYRKANDQLLLPNERPGDKSLNMNPYMPEETKAFVYEGLNAMKSMQIPHTKSRSSRQNEAVSSVLIVGSPEWRSDIARKAANAKHNKPGGTRDKQKQIQDIWASGKYSSKDRCAEEECGALGMSFKAARNALINLPKPKKPPRC